jgi:Mce-associated membrane protein
VNPKEVIVPVDPAVPADPSSDAPIPADPEVAEALAEAKRAEERDEAARILAARVRKWSTAHLDAVPDTALGVAKDTAQGVAEVVEVDGAAVEDDDRAAADTPAQKPPRRSLRHAKRAVVTAVAVLVCALLGASGYMLWQQRAADQQRQRSAEYAAAAKQAVVTLMSLNFHNSEDDVQRVIDNSTGKFKRDFESQSAFLVEALQKSRVVTEVTVNHVAVESMSADSAVVLVSSRSQASNSEDERKQPQFFRVAVTLARDAGQLKISQVDML